MTGWFNKWMAQRRINKLLCELGSNSREVANVLLHMGIRGKRGAGECCPITVFVRRQGYRAYVNATSLYLIDGDNWQRIPLPEVCSQFIKDFDAGAYPYLVK